MFHYLDDYITIGPPQSDLWQHNLRVVKDTYDQLGVPIEADKTEGPSTCITFFVNLVIRLPESKLIRLRQLLQEWSGCKAMSKRNLCHSLVTYSMLRQAGLVFRGLSTVVRHLDGLMRLNRLARSDIVWWQLFAEQWNGSSMLCKYQQANPQVEVFSDASGRWGCRHTAMGSGSSFSGQTAWKLAIFHLRR